MHGLGTLINALAIIAGGLLGIGCKRFLKEHYQETIMKATGFAVVFLGAAGTLSKMLVFTEDGTGLTTTGSMIMILSLTFGALIGEIIDIDGLFERFGEWLKHRTGSDGDNQFTNGFVAASLTVSIGAMAIIGSIQDGIYGDYSTLTAKAVLDFIIVLIISVFIIWFYLHVPMTKKLLPLRICAVFIFSGAIGNFIDRLKLGYVVDFFYFKLIDFPVFNVADIYVTVGTFILAFLLLFYYKEEDLDRIFHS